MKTILFFVLALLPVFGQRDPTSTEITSGYMTVTVAASASVSESVVIRGRAIASFEIPVLTAANLTFQVSSDGSTWVNLYDEFGVEVTVITGDGTVARAIRVSPGDWWGYRYIRIRTGTAASPVTQASARSIKISFR